MKFYRHRTPPLIKYIYSDCLYSKQTKDKTLFLTFDDGPHQCATPFVLNELEKYNAKATFFCLGKNADQNPGLLNEIISSGHGIGNHTYDHIDGWKVSLKDYIYNVDKCRDAISRFLQENEMLFRPPYGRLSPRQYLRLKKEYKIILWTYLTGDFDEKLSIDVCINKALTSLKSGDIVVMHENAKSIKSLKILLPELLKTYSERGYLFSTL